MTVDPMSAKGQHYSFRILLNHWPQCEG